MRTFVSFKIKINRAGSKGRGVFAKSFIKKGEILEVSPYIEIQGSDYRQIEESILMYYWYEVQSRIRAIGLGYTSLYNHSKENNADFTVLQKSKHIKIKAVKDIKKGEEIHLNYGYDV